MDGEAKPAPWNCPSSRPIERVVGVGASVSGLLQFGGRFQTQRRHHPEPQRSPLGVVDWNGAFGSTYQGTNLSGLMPGTYVVNTGRGGISYSETFEVEEPVLSLTVSARIAKRGPWELP